MAVPPTHLLLIVGDLGLSGPPLPHSHIHVHAKPPGGGAVKGSKISPSLSRVIPRTLTRSRDRDSPEDAPETLASWGGEGQRVPHEGGDIYSEA